MRTKDDGDGRGFWKMKSETVITESRRECSTETLSRTSGQC